MTENEYSIKPLVNIPNITKLNSSQDGKGKNKRKSSRKQVRKKKVVSEMDHSANEECDIQSIGNLHDDGIDFCA